MRPPLTIRRPSRTVPFALAAVLLSACGTPVAEDAAASSRRERSVTVDVCGEDVTFPRTPARVLTNDQNMLEMLLALGLEEHIVAATGVGEAVPDELADGFQRIGEVSEDYIGDLESVLAHDVQLVYAGWNYGLSEGSGITPDALARHGVATYVLRESCRRVAPEMGPTTMDDVYHDARALGAIFGVEDRAEELIARWEDTVADARALVPDDAAPAPVFLYDSGEDEPLTAGRLAMPHTLIGIAGGTNIAGDVEDTWVRIGWEDVVDRDPAYIPVMGYGGQTAEDRIAFLTSHPALAAVEAVAEERFTAFSYADMVPGIRSADTALRLARFLWGGRA